MRFERTCNACPEQYDVYHGKDRIGYVRLRWGYFSVLYTPDGNLSDSSARQVFATRFPEPCKGTFTVEERPFYLKQAKKALRKALKEDE